LSACQVKERVKKAWGKEIKAGGASVDSAGNKKRRKALGSCPGILGSELGKNGQSGEKGQGENPVTFQSRWVKGKPYKKFTGGNGGGQPSPSFAWGGGPGGKREGTFGGQKSLKKNSGSCSVWGCQKKKKDLKGNLGKSKTHKKGGGVIKYRKKYYAILWN